MKKFARIGLAIANVLILNYQKSSAATGQLMAGTAKVNITPEKTVEPVHDSLYARVLVLDVAGKRVAFVALDLAIFASDRVESICRQKFGVEHVMLSSSHTHSEPKENKKMAFQGNSFVPFYEDQIIKAVGQAVKTMFPARIAAGKKIFPQLGFNRLVVREDGHAKESWLGDEHYRPENPDRIPFGPVDPELGVIKIEDMQGLPRAVLMNYACHADIVCFNYAVSADYPGVASRKVEEAFDNKLVCLFVQGAGGNVEALQISPRRSGPDSPVKTNYQPMERTGELLAYETINLTKNLVGSNGKTDMKFMADSMMFSGRFNKNVKFNVHLLSMLINNDIAIAVCPGEFFAQLQLDYKKRMSDANVSPFLFGYTWTGGKWPGYVADIRSAALGGYGADTSPDVIQVGAGESIIDKQIENYYILSGLMQPHWR